MQRRPPKRPLWARQIVDTIQGSHPTLVKAALDLGRRSEPCEDSSSDVGAEAKQALVQLGYPSAVAAAAVQAACADVGMNIELPLLIKEALRRCGG